MRRSGEKAGELTSRVRKAESYEEVRSCLMEMEEFSKHMGTAATIVSIRHTLDTRDEFYEKEDAGASCA